MPCDMPSTSTGAANRWSTGVVPLRVSASRAGLSAVYVEPLPKYPTASAKTFTATLDRRQTVPDADKATIVRLALVTPVTKFNIEAVGSGGKGRTG